MPEHSTNKNPSQPTLLHMKQNQVPLTFPPVLWSSFLQSNWSNFRKGHLSHTTEPRIGCNSPGEVWSMLSKAELLATWKLWFYLCSLKLCAAASNFWLLLILSDSSQSSPFPSSQLGATAMTVILANSPVISPFCTVTCWIKAVDPSSSSITCPSISFSSETAEKKRN